MQLQRKLNVLHDRFLQLYLVHLADLTQLYQILWRCVVLLLIQQKKIIFLEPKQNKITVGSSSLFSLLLIYVYILQNLYC